MALIHRWPFVPSLNGGDITLDIVGGLTTTNIGSMTQSENDGAQCVVDASKYLTFSKNLGDTWSIISWAKYANTPTAYDVLFGNILSATNIATIVYIPSNQTMKFYSNYGSNFATFSSDQKNLLFNGSWHLLGMTFSSGTLTGYVDNLAVSASSLASPAAGTYYFGGYGGYGSIAKRKDLQIHNAVLSSDDVAALVTAGPNPITNPQYSYAI